MSKVLTFSTKFPSYHPKAGQPTYFVEKILLSIGTILQKGAIHEEHGRNILPKHHTIRSGHRFKAGDYFSPRIWSGKPYDSKQIVIAPEIKVEKVWNFFIECHTVGVNVRQYAYRVNHNYIKSPDEIAKNDGLMLDEFIHWFAPSIPFTGQIICWNKNINY